MGYYPPGPYPPGPYGGPGGHTATVLVPSGAATTVTVLQGEIFEGAPVQTVCPRHKDGPAPALENMLK